MRCRSESVKRTVVDLSFSFFIALDSRNRTSGLSLPTEQGTTARRQLFDISRYHPAKYLSERGVAIRMVIYKIPGSQKRAPSPIRNSSEQARRGRGSPIWIQDLLCLCTESEMNGRGSSIRPNLAFSAISNARQSETVRLTMPSALLLAFLCCSTPRMNSLSLLNTSSRETLIKCSLSTASVDKVVPG